MRFFHLSDLHIGRTLHGYSLKEDQEHILGEVVEYAKKLRPDAIVIAGDIYDRPAPSAEAVTIFDGFLTALAKITPAIPVLMIAGNHDSAGRLDYARRILENQNIYIAGKVPSREDPETCGHIRKVTLGDAFGEVDFYLLPFLKPGYVRGLFTDSQEIKSEEVPQLEGANEAARTDSRTDALLLGGKTEQMAADKDAPRTYSEAVARMIEREHIDWTRRNVLVSHQFYTGAGQEMMTCDSEIFSVGGIDNVDIRGIQNFDYAALGHLHGAQSAGLEYIRYCGTLLKYSVSEAKQEKSLHMVELTEKGGAVKIEKLPLHPLRDVQVLRGTLEDILQSAVSDDYVSITLTDDTEHYRPKEQLERRFSHILEIRVDNERTRRRLHWEEEEEPAGTPLSVFSEFFEEMQGRAMSEEEETMMEHVMDTLL